MRYVLPNVLAIALAASTTAQQPSRDAAIAAMKPYDGPASQGVDRSTLTGKVMAGYQGWFTV